MRGVTTRQKTTECQKRLEKTLTKSLKQRKIISIGYQSGSMKPNVHHNGTVWFYSEKLDNRFWNAFGLNPDEDAQKDIVVEINPPLNGIDPRKGAGMFAFDEDDSLSLLHSGRIGGGRKGIGPKAFREWYLQFTPMKDVEIGEGNVRNGILVGNIEEDSFLDDLEIFVRNVWLFKRLARNGANEATYRNDLLAELQEMGGNAGTPGRRETTISTYGRNPIITERAKLLAGGVCRLCREEGPFMDTVHDLPFLETHHVTWLSKGGRDSIDNTVALCPNCHRKMHHVADKGDIKKLREIARKQKRPLR